MPKASAVSVLIVDDQQSMRGICKYILNQLGFKDIIEAKSGRDALGKLEQSNVDLIISDWNMDDIDGLTLLKVIRKHPRLGHDALAAQGGFPLEMLDVVLHHHEFLDGTGYPDRLSADQISDIVRLTTIVDVYAALVENRAYRLPFTHSKAFAIMEEMGGKLDQPLLQAFRPVAMGSSY